MDIISKIKDVIEKVRPYLMFDGGDVEFIKYEDGIVYVKLTGNCANCSIADFEIKDTVESILTSEIPEVIEVRQVND